MTRILVVSFALASVGGLLGQTGATTQRIQQFEWEHGPRWTPAPLLARLAREGRTFGDYDKEDLS